MRAFVYKCPGCGANVQFNIEKQTFHCAYCENDYTLETMQEIYNKSQELNAKELEKNEAKNKKKKETETTEQKVIDQAESYRCKQCGATIISDENTVATFCLYCSNPSIVKEHVENVFAPDLVIPFKVTKEEAVKEFKKWCGKKRLVPDDFKSIKQQEKMSGLYIPYWLYDVKIDFDFDGTGNKVRSWHSGNYRYTKTDTYKIERQGVIEYQKVPADGSSKMDDTIMKVIEPYNYQELKDFDPSYLSGFFAEKYDEEMEECYKKIQKDITSGTESEIRKTLIGYTSTIFPKKMMNPNENKTYYSFFPVWILSYKYNDKIYQFTMNGQTGKLVGDIPIDKKKVIALFIKTLLLLTIVFFIGGMFIL